MEKWEKNEIDCCTFLNNTYGYTGTLFNRIGGSDSTHSDILVKTKKEEFYIEAKMSSAQCGQFVLFPDNNKSVFIFSPKNKNKLTESCGEIIQMMNDDYDYYSSSDKNKSMPISEAACALYARCIIDNYKSKDVRFIIAHDNGEFTILPLEKLREYFDISAVYRVKKSGSGNPTSEQVKLLTDYLKQKCPDVSVKIDGDHCLVYNCPSSLHKVTIGNYDYLLRDDGGYCTVRRLSNTYNSNVIFSIKLKKKQDQDDLECFVSTLS